MLTTKTHTPNCANGLKNKFDELRQQASSGVSLDLHYAVSEVLLGIWTEGIR